MDYRVIRYRPEFRKDVLELQKHLWGRDLDLNAAYFAWKYEHNPYTSEPLIYLLLAGDKVVGMRGFQGAKWQFGGSGPAQLCLCAGDLVVDPAYRGRGLFNPIRSIMQFATADLARLGHDYIFNLSANRINGLASLRMGWRLVAPFEEFQRHASMRVSAMSRARKFSLLQRTRKHVLRIPVLRRAARLGSSRSPAQVFHALDTLSPLKESQGVLEISRDPRPRVMAELARHAEPQNRLRHVRSEEYFAWRFQDPMREYRFLFWGDPDPRGFLVLQSRAVTRPVSIVDWEVASSEAWDHLLGAVVRLGAFNTLSIWSATLPKNMTDKLRCCGFAPVLSPQDTADYDPGLLVKALNDSMPKAFWQLDGRSIMDIAHWDLRMIYSDYY